MLAQISDDELLARLIGRRVEGRGLISLLEMDGHGLREAGLSEMEAAAVSVVAEIARRHQPRATEEGPIRGPAVAVSLLGDLRRAMSAQLILMLLDRRHRLLTTICAAQSAYGCPQASPSLLTKHAEEAGAASAILAHNHPDGTAVPTGADIVFTASVWQGCTSAGVDLADHIVVTSREWFSFRRAGLLR